jgi:GH24 family phage-related lysozyme (muramidase)
MIYMANENDQNVLLDSMLRTMEFEGGFKPNVYLDTEGYPTIGFGHLLDSTKYSIPEGASKDWVPEQYKDIVWTKEKGEKTFLDDYLRMEKDVANRYGKDEFSKLPTDVRDVLTDLAFNMGPSKLFGKFKGFLKDIKSGEYGEAAKELKYKNPDKGNMEMSLWWNQVGGDTTEAKNLKRSGNRATSAFDLLTSLVK